MYNSSIDHGKIIEAFRKFVPGCFVRDYRENGGFITVCRDYKDIPWRDQTTTRNVYYKVPAVTLLNLPKGFVTPATKYRGVRLDRPGWRREFRRAMRHLSDVQMRKITRFLKCGEVFPGVR